MKKITLYSVAFLIVLLGGYIVYEKFYNGGDNKNPIANNQPSDNPKSEYNDGEYVGNVADAFYGSLQVKTTIANGKIIDIQFLQYPDKKGYTLDLNNQVMPVLKSEALQAQKAEVDIISGATQTSQAFMQSLATALTNAGSQNQIKIEVTPPTPLV